MVGRVKDNQPESVGFIADAAGQPVCTRDSRRVGVERHGRPSRTRMADLLGEVLAIAAREGQTRSMVADQVGKSARSIASYVEYGTGGVDCPGPVLLEMIQNPGVLGERARMALIDSVLRPAGLAVHALPDAETASRGTKQIEREALDVNAAVGRMTQEVVDAMDDGVCTDAERDRIQRAVEGVISETLEMAGAVVAGRIGSRDGGAA